MTSDQVDIKLTGDTLSLQEITGRIEAETTGGTCVFIGTVRSQTSGKTVTALEFEAYAPMALAEMEKIAQTAMAKWPILRMAIHHRTGRLSIGEIPVIIGVAAAHRDAAFEACRYCIDTLKETVPIWKKEIFEDGEIWVAAHP